MKKPLRFLGRDLEVLHNSEFVAAYADLMSSEATTTFAGPYNTAQAAFLERWPRLIIAAKQASQELGQMRTPIEAYVVNGDNLYAYAPEVFNGVRSAGYPIK